MFRKINKMFRIAIWIAWMGVFLVKVAKRDLQEQIAGEKCREREKDAFQEKEFDDIW